jgi:hypothetical protein
MSAIHFETKPYKLGDWIILRLPEEASAKLPSRGQTMVEGTLNGVPFKTPLEPDGNWSHWLKIDDELQRTARASAGATVALTIEPTKDWPEPEVPEDLKRALAAAPKAHALWEKITPMARWEWIRWTRSTNRDETRKRRVEVAMSKLESGERRPCCWNRNLCTEPSVSKNGVLLGPV